jgi:hypothetical protein
MYDNHRNINTNSRRRTLSNSVASWPACMKIWKSAALVILGSSQLLVRHSFSKSELLRVLAHGIAANLEHHLLPQLSLSRNFRELLRQPF